MVIYVFVTGLPRTATTYMYKLLYTELRRYVDVVGVYEPFNHEVVEQLAAGVQHIHDTEGPVPHDWVKLPESTRKLILENSRWLREWVTNPSPSTRFLGEKYLDILHALHELDAPVIVKDVCAWLRLNELVDKFPDTVFVVTLRDFDSLFEEAKRRLRINPNPLHKAGYGVFYRAVTGGQYYREVSEVTLERELFTVYRTLMCIVDAVWRRKNVIVVPYRNRLPEERARIAVDAVLQLLDEYRTLLYPLLC